MKIKINKLKKIYPTCDLEFFSFYGRKNSELFILDEAGFGTKPLRRYGNSKIGTPAILQKKLLKFNLTCSTTISKYGVEFI